MVSAKKADFNDWALEFQISPVLARIIRNRDITEKDDVRKYLSGTMADCYSPFLLSDCGKAVELILQKIRLTSCKNLEVDVFVYTQHPQILICHTVIEIIKLRSHT